MNPSSRPRRRLAFDVEWWVRWRDIDPVQAALVAARADHMSHAIEAAIARNKARNRRPMTFAQLAGLLHRDTVNVWRWRKGLQEPGVADMMGLAQILRVPVADLFPSLEDSLAKATLFLCKGNIEAKEAMLYSEYLAIRNRMPSADLDSLALEAALGRPGGKGFTQDSAADSLWKVADKLEPILAHVALLDLDGPGYPARA